MNLADPLHQHISLMHGWAPTTVQAVATAFLLLAIGRRSARWGIVWLPLALIVGVATAAIAHWYIDSAGLADDPAPQALWIWIGLTGLAAAVLLPGWRARSVHPASPEFRCRRPGPPGRERRPARPSTRRRRQDSDPICQAGSSLGTPTHGVRGHAGRAHRWCWCRRWSHAALVGAWLALNPVVFPQSPERRGVRLYWHLMTGYLQRHRCGFPGVR
jgi:hypothetical protein